MSKKELSNGKNKINLGDDYILDNDDFVFEDKKEDLEKEFFSDASEPREFFEDDNLGEDFEGDYDDFEFIDDDDLGEGFSDSNYTQGEPDNETLFKDTTDADMETFVLWWRTIDETRASFLSAKFGGDPKRLLFYPDIDKKDSYLTVKKSGAILVKKYSELIFFSHAPEMILTASLLLSSVVVFMRAKKEATTRKEDVKKQQSTPEKRERQQQQEESFEYAKTA